MVCKYVLSPSAVFQAQKNAASVKNASFDLSTEACKLCPAALALLVCVSMYVLTNVQSPCCGKKRYLISLVFFQVRVVTWTSMNAHPTPVITVERVSMKSIASGVCALKVTITRTVSPRQMAASVIPACTATAHTSPPGKYLSSL